MTTNLNKTSVTNSSSLYEQDYSLWIETTVKQIREQQFNLVDWENLLEELESLGRSERNALKSRLTVLLLHLLKYRYQPSYRSNSWICTINEQHRQIVFLLEDNPSLKTYLAEIFDKCYIIARRDAATETGLPADTFPVESPFSFQETLNPDYLK